MGLLFYFAEDSHEISRHVFSEKIRKKIKMSSAAVVIGALRVNINSVDIDQTPHSVASDQGLHCLPITLL